MSRREETWVKLVRWTWQGNGETSDACPNARCLDVGAIFIGKRGAIQFAVIKERNQRGCFIGRKGPTVDAFACASDPIDPPVRATRSRRRFEPDCSQAVGLIRCRAERARP